MSLLDQIMDCTGCSPEQAGVIQSIGVQTTGTVNTVCCDVDSIVQEIGVTINETIQTAILPIVQADAIITSLLQQQITVINRLIEEIADSIRAQQSIITNEYLLTLRLTYPCIGSGVYYGETLLPNCDGSGNVKVSGISALGVQQGNISGANAGGGSAAGNGITGSRNLASAGAGGTGGAGRSAFGPAGNGIPTGADANTLTSLNPGAVVSVQLLDGSLALGTIVNDGNGPCVRVQSGTTGIITPPITTIINPPVIRNGDQCVITIRLIAPGVKELDGYTGAIYPQATVDNQGYVYVAGGKVSLPIEFNWDANIFYAAIQYDGDTLWTCSGPLSSLGADGKVTLGPCVFSDAEKPAYGEQIVSGSDKAPVQLAIVFDLSQAIAADGCVTGLQTGIGPPPPPPPPPELIRTEIIEQQTGGAGATCPDGTPNNWTNPVGIEQPYAFRFEQRQKPWFRDAVDFMLPPMRNYINATSEQQYLDDVTASMGEMGSDDINS